MAGPVHYEIFVRRKPGGPWTLDCAVEDRGRLSEIADELLEQRRAVAVRAQKETFDPVTGEFQSVVIFTRGEAAPARKGKAPVEDPGALCVTPADLYTAHAREKIGRLLEGWLKRRRVTAFELLHRVDLIEEIEASGAEIQHALQKIAIPEAQARGLSVHEVIRQMQGLVERSIARVRKDAKSFPVVTVQTFAAEAERLASAEPLYMLGGGVARALGEATGWRAKVRVLVELAEAAPPGGRARALALAALEAPLAEILGQASSLADLFGAELDLGGGLAALTCLAAPREARAVRAMDAGAASALPVLTEEAQRLSALMEIEAFEGVRAALGKRVLAEINGPRRLRPDDPEGEIAVLRALAMVLTASSGRLLPLEDVQAAFIERSKRLVAAEFITAFTAAAGGGEAVAEVRAMVRLAENVVGAMNKRDAARWLQSSLTALRFEKEVRAGRESPVARLSALAELHKALGEAGLPEKERAVLQARVGEAGGWVDADTGVTALLAASAAPASVRCVALARMASGEACPPGPAAERAAGELLKLMRNGDVRAAIAKTPEAALKVRDALSRRAPAAA